MSQPNLLLFHVEQQDSSRMQFWSSTDLQ